MKYGKHKAKERNKELETLKSELAELEADTVKNSKNIAKTKKRLNARAYEEDRKTIFKSRVNWTEKGEKCTKYFFNVIKNNAKKSNVMALAENGVDLTKNQINDRVFDFYSNLYSKKASTISPEVQVAMDACPKVPDQYKEALERDIPIT